MEKYIYKITNLVNGKVYIGQTTNYNRRFSEHKKMGYGKEDSKYLYNAMSHYGIENFKFEVIEKCENYNEREKYWIKHYNSYCGAEGGWGYNMTEGGEEPPLHIKENSPFATHSQEDVNKVIDLIQNTKISFIDIAKMTNYDASSIKRINEGKLWHDNNLKYPLRIYHSHDFIQDRAFKIISDLQNTTLSQKEIAEKYGVARSTVTAINNGQNNRQEELSYPLRKHKAVKGKPFYMLDLNDNILKEFTSLVDAARLLGDEKKNDHIGACLRGKSKTAYGYKWKYKE